VERKIHIQRQIASLLLVKKKKSLIRWHKQVKGCLLIWQSEGTEKFHFTSFSEILKNIRDDDPPLMNVKAAHFNQEKK
jgi:hypothetical protein